MEQFTQWDVIVTLTTFFGFLALLLKPAITLVQSLTRLVAATTAMEKRIACLEDDNKTEHKEFKDKIESHDTLLNKHDLILCNQTTHNGG